jgi:hypothetical protein
MSLLLSFAGVRMTAFAVAPCRLADGGGLPPSACPVGWPQPGEIALVDASAVDAPNKDAPNKDAPNRMMYRRQPQRRIVPPGSRICGTEYFASGTMSTQGVQPA